MEDMAATRMIRFISDPEELQREDLRYWQTLSASERFAEARRLSVEQYRLQGVESVPGQRLAGPVVRLQRV